MKNHLTKVPWSDCEPMVYPGQWYTGRYIHRHTGEIFETYHLDCYSERADPIWRDNKPFKARMKITNCTRGRSAARFVLESKGVEYEVFMTDMLKILKEATIKAGKVYGTWHFCKRGSNYGLQLKEVYNAK